MSDKQRVKNRLWRETTLRKWLELGGVCQWCGRFVEEPDGHHIIKRRFNIHTQENCYICHRLPCHRFIEDNNVDVAVYKMEREWLEKDLELWDME